MVSSYEDGMLAIWGASELPIRRAIGWREIRISQQLYVVI